MNTHQRRNLRRRFIPRRNLPNYQGETLQKGKHDWKVYRYEKRSVFTGHGTGGCRGFRGGPPFTSSAPGYSRQVSRVSRHVQYSIPRRYQYGEVPIDIILDTTLMVGAIASITQPISKVSFILMILGTIISLEYVNPILLNRSSLPGSSYAEKLYLVFCPGPSSAGFRNSSDQGSSCSSGLVFCWHFR